MDSPDWPETCDLATASALFDEAGFKIDPSNLSRFIAKNNFPSEKRGRSRFVDPKALFIACGHDYTRRKMAGQSHDPVPQLPHTAAAAPIASTLTPKDDPRLERDRIILTQKRMELARDLGQLVPTAEVEAAAAEGFAELRAAIGEIARDFAEKIVLGHHLPATATAQLVATLKAFGRALQMRFTEPQIRVASQLETPGAPERERFYALVRLCLQLRGELNEEDAATAADHLSEGASAPSESSGEC